MKRKLILLRHAHRDKFLGQSADNGLSEKGAKHAEKIAAQLAKRIKDSSKIKLQSSPKQRCVETINPLSKVTKQKYIIQPLLDEQHGDESTQKFIDRIEQYVSLFKSANDDFVVACSHGDWIPTCTDLLTGQEHTISKGAWVELEFDGKEFTIGAVG